MTRRMNSQVAFMLEKPSPALTSRFIPFTTQEYKGGPVIATSKISGGGARKSCKC